MPPRTRRPRGRPAGAAPVSREAILDAVHRLLQEGSVRDLTMEAIARRAGVGKPTLYRWWPSKAALVVDMFMARIAAEEGAEPSPAGPAAEELRTRMRRMVRELNGVYGKVLADLIAEGQSDPGVLRELFDRKIGPRRDSTAAMIERGQASGELRQDLDAEVVVDMLAGPMYYRLLLRHAPLTEAYADALVDHVLRSIRAA